VAAVVNFASPLRPLFDPVKLGIAASFILCFAIVVTPHRFVRPAPLSGLSPAGHLDGDPTNLAQFAPAMAEPGVPEPVREAPGPAPEQAQLARAGADALPQPVAENLPVVDAPKHNLLDREQARAVQRRLAELGYLSVSATGVWGPRSRNALRAFKSDHELAADENWDQATERSLFSGTLEPAQPFIGIWGADASACSSRLNRKGLLPAVIDGEGAWAGETFCTFESKKRIAGGWNVVANCSNAHDRWIANVHLMINGNLLTWTSERGSQNYQRCQPGYGVARAF
jgi:hypothetical protein